MPFLQSLLLSVNRTGYRPQTKFAKVMFLQVSVCPQWGGRHCHACPPCHAHPPADTTAMAWGRTWQGACMAGGVFGGMHGRGCAWQRGACMAGRHVWQGGAWQGGHAWQGHAWWGACVAGGRVHGRGVCVPCTPPSRYYSYGIWSMSGRYASYCNAFLFGTVVTCYSLYSTPEMYTVKFIL